MILRLLNRFTHGILVASPFMRRAYLQTTGCDARKLFVIANPVSPVKSQPDARLRIRERMAVDSNTIVVAMVAQLVPWKRHDLFLEASARVLQERKDIQFWIVGTNHWGRNGVYINALQKRAGQSDLAGHVTFLGELDDVSHILAASDFVVLPSQREPFGRVVVEAWWAERPVIVSDGGGPADLVNHEREGLVFREGSLEELAKCMSRLADDQSLRARLAEAGRSHAEHFVPSLHAEAVTAVYRQVLECA
jgi:glycosyltransferase involved in cell wall biosynthesis